MTLGGAEYERYCKKLRKDPEEAKDKAIILTFGTYEDTNIFRNAAVWGELVDYQPGDRIRGQDATIDGKVYAALDEEGRRNYLAEKPWLELEVLCQTTVQPMQCYDRKSFYVIVSDEWMDAHTDAELSGYGAMLYLDCQDPKSFADQLQEQYGDELLIYRNYEERDSIRNMYLATAVLLYSFVGIITLVGMTNIFNTITANMELRAPEFATLLAVGMTQKEFRRMIWLEGLFCAGRAFGFAVPLGLMLSYGFYRILSAESHLTYHPPIFGILLAAAVVFGMLYGIMRYAIRKIGKKSIIETIRNENI